MEEEKKIIHCWDEEEKRFFIWGDENDSVWQRRSKRHEEFLIHLYKTAQWVIPAEREPNYNSQYFPLVKIETL